MIITNDTINLCKARDRAAQKQLYRKMVPYLNVVCRRYLHDDSYISDILQEVFIQIFTKIAQFDPERGAFKNWAIKISVNACLKHNQKHAKENLQELVLPLHEKKVNPYVLQKYSDEDLMNFLRQMPTAYFQVFSLYVIDGFDHKEIAEMLEINDSLSRKRLSRAKAWIEKKTSVSEWAKVSGNRSF